MQHWVVRIYKRMFRGVQQTSTPIPGAGQSSASAHSSFSSLSSSPLQLPLLLLSSLLSTLPPFLIFPSASHYSCPLPLADSHHWYLIPLCASHCWWVTLFFCALASLVPSRAESSPSFGAVTTGSGLPSISVDTESKCQYCDHLRATPTAPTLPELHRKKRLVPNVRGRKSFTNHISGKGL